ncbi:MAG: hypothetical protein ICV62_14530 [Cyanobacteria bacterium Co-bin13]|nr:hypothetical protein [Cyanobacteria bacterium Co-bin13]
MMLSTRQSPKEIVESSLQSCQKALRRTVGPSLSAVSWKKSPYWGLGLASLSLSLINGPLVISLGAGLVTYQQLSQLTPEQWQQLTQRLQKQRAVSLSARNKTLLLSGTALAATYLTTAIWSETHQAAVAIALGTQSLLTLSLLAWLLRSAPPSPSAPLPPQSLQPDTLESLLAELTHPDPLRRLVRVRQLTRMATPAAAETGYLDGGVVTVRSHLIDCFHLMLSQESEPLVRTALREGLQHLRQPAQLPEGAPPLPNAKAMKQTHRVRRPVVEYIEP